MKKQSSKLPDDSTVTAPKKGMTEIERAILQAFEHLAKALDARADDDTTIYSRSGPKSARAVKMALHHVADVMSGKKKLVVKPRAVFKRVPNTAPSVPLEQQQIEES